MRTVGTAANVIDEFVEGRPLRTAQAQVPGGSRLAAQHEPRGLVLYSYRTEVAILQPDGTFVLTLRRYTRSTSKAMSALRAALTRAGLQPTGASTFSATVPGRWNGWGPAWHSTGVETVPAETWS